MTDASSRSSPLLHDLWARLALSPIFGVAIPTLSGLVDPRLHSGPGLILSYVAFSVVAFVVWEGNRRLYFRLSRREDWLERPWHRARLLLTVIVLFTIPVSSALLMIWQRVTGDTGLRPYAVPTAVLAIVAVVAVITNVYETVFLLRDWESARLRSARSESARLAAELDRLTRQVDPHFLFNNLHALQHLIEHHDPRAVRFVEALSDTYRYVLASRGRHLVPLGEELEALDHHRILASTRYGDVVSVDVHLEPADASSFLLPPVSLGELLLNALKHNQVDVGTPLVLRIRRDGDVLIVDNLLVARSRASRSTGAGLTNLAERVRLAEGRTMSWGVHDGWFRVSLPLTRVGED